jgi:hypothetical protein
VSRSQCRGCCQSLIKVCWKVPTRGTAAHRLPDTQVSTAPALWVKDPADEPRAQRDASPGRRLTHGAQRQALISGISASAPEHSARSRCSVSGVATKLAWCRAGETPRLQLTGAACLGTSRALALEQPRQSAGTQQGPSGPGHTHLVLQLQRAQLSHA